MQPTVKRIVLSGVLGKRFGREYNLAVNSPAEAVRALGVMVPGFERFLNEAKDKYNLTFAVYKGKRNISADEISGPAGEEEIRFAPVVIGSKNGGILMTVLGAVLVVAGFLIPSPLSSALISAGVSMIAGGLAQMLSPSVKTDKPADKDGPASSTFNGPVNTQAQGNPVPVLYGGPIIVGSAVISASIQASDNVYVPIDNGDWGSFAGAMELINGGGGSTPFHDERA